MRDKFNEHAANERTFLAWVRTAIAVVGFGLAAARLGGQQTPVWSDIALIVSGGLVVLLSYIRMQIHRKQIDRLESFDDKPAPIDLLLLGLVFSLFALMVFFALHIT
ncbi:DUF202 domain-containing protein [Microbulbifer sp. SAOS-129_SWC]|uniref:YidH family protein n=1 Tax=Microbulbifer sp. SAOS-129_SWC TaxID=3145235 RepID=UPI003217A84F